MRGREQLRGGRYRAGGWPGRAQPVVSCPAPAPRSAWGGLGTSSPGLPHRAGAALRRPTRAPLLSPPLVPLHRPRHSSTLPKSTEIYQTRNRKWKEKRRASLQESLVGEASSGPPVVQSRLAARSAAWLRPLRRQCWMRDSSPSHLGRSSKGLYVRALTPSMKLLAWFCTGGFRSPQRTVAVTSPGPATQVKK